MSKWHCPGCGKSPWETGLNNNCDDYNLPASGEVYIHVLIPNGANSAAGSKVTHSVAMCCQPCWLAADLGTRMGYLKTVLDREDRLAEWPHWAAVVWKQQVRAA